MARPARTLRVRRLHAQRRALTADQLARHLCEEDPFDAAPIAHGLWAEEALLVQPSQLFARACAGLAAAFMDAPRATPWGAWVARQVADAAEALRREDPATWRTLPFEPTPFERAVGACFGVADEDVLALIRRFHALEREDRRALHALLPRAMFGLPHPDRRPGAGRRAMRRAREDAQRGVAVMRALLAALRQAGA
ncbi:MAG: hypothetical protein R3F49_07615 [Planctomycetota bacterium]